VFCLAIGFYALRLVRGGRLAYADGGGVLSRYARAVRVVGKVVRAVPVEIARPYKAARNIQKTRYRRLLFRRHTAIVTKTHNGRQSVGARTYEMPKHGCLGVPYLKFADILEIFVKILK
jgi:hypothetical protein